MRVRHASRARKAGLSPGTPVYLGRERAHPVAIQVTDYDAQRLTIHHGAEGLSAPEVSGGVRWVDVDGVHDVREVSRLGEAFQLHPLLVEDIANADARPKVEDYDAVVFILMKHFHVAVEGDIARVTPEQISVVLGPSWVLTFQEIPGDPFQAVRTRLRENRGRMRSLGADYLAYALLDVTVDGYFTALELVADVIERLEQTSLTGTPKEQRMVPHRFHQVRQELNLLRRNVLPLAAAMPILQRECRLIRPETQVFLRDVADHLTQVMDQIENLRASLEALLDTHLSLQNQRLGEITKVLTVVATIFIPLTFIVGIYGMNFDYMPELRWRWGYFATLGFMAATVVVMLYAFRRRGWM